MNSNDLQKANMLMSKIRMIEMAVNALKRGETIVSMSIGRPSPEESFNFMPVGVQVPTEGIKYPPEMLTSIQRQFEARWKELSDELTALGATDIPGPTEAKK